MNKQKKNWKIVWGATIFEGKKKVKEFKFKTEKDLVYWLYKNEPFDTLRRNK